MKKLLLCLSILSLVACQQVIEQTVMVSEVQDVNAIADQYIEDLFKFSPESSTFYQAANADNINLSDISPEGIQRSEDAQDKLYQALSLIDVIQLDKNDNITYQLLKTELEGAINQRVCNRHLWSINHLGAFYT